MQGNKVVEDKIEKFIKDRTGREFSDMSVEEKMSVIEKLQRGCKCCSLWSETGLARVPSELRPGSKYVFIGRNPNKTEAMSNQIFDPKTTQGGMFEKYLSFLGLDRREVSILNLCNCSRKHNQGPLSMHIATCTAFKKFELDVIGNDVKIIFAMGQGSLKWVLGDSAPDTLQSIGKIFTYEYHGNKVLVVPLIHPSHLVIAPELAYDTGEWLKELGGMIKNMEA